jgi:hypothetical protein
MNKVSDLFMGLPSQVRQGERYGACLLYACRNSDHQVHLVFSSPYLVAETKLNRTTPIQIVLVAELNQTTPAHCSDHFPLTVSSLMWHGLIWRDTTKVSNGRSNVYTLEIIEHLKQIYYQRKNRTFSRNVMIIIFTLNINVITNEMSDLPLLPN